jgi:hypothetical protein
MGNMGFVIRRQLALFPYSLIPLFPYSLIPVSRFPMLFGRHMHPVVRLGFKPRRGRQTLPGRFDSCCLPPVVGRVGTRTHY